MSIKIYPFGQFVFGISSKEPPNRIPDGAASDSLNWLTLRGKIELCRGYSILGTTINGSNSPVSGLRAGQKSNGDWVAFATYDRKVRYYTEAIADWTEVGSNILPAAASGEDMTLSLFECTAGKQMWLNSPNTGPMKFNLVNPGDYISMYDSSKNYKGWMRFFDNRAYLWNIDNFDKTAVRLSYAEVRMRTDYSQVTGETLVNGAAVAQKTSTPKASIFDISATAGAETFTDDLNGIMTGSAGGSGTVNYQTGVITLSPAAGVAATFVVSYRYIDENATWVTAGGATQGSIGNFVVPTTRIANSPNVYQQGHGGDIVDVAVLNNHHFCMHKRSFFDIVQSQDDLTSTNTIFRDTLGIFQIGSAFATAEGIYTIDTTDPVDQRFILVEYSQQSTDIKPRILSYDLDLLNYEFDQSVVFPFADYILFACRTKDSAQNNRIFAYHRIFRRWDILDYCVSCFDIYNDKLLAGDSLTPNVQNLFSGFDANGDLITNHWTSGISRLGYMLPRGKPRILYGQKKAKKLFIEGYIGPNQKMSISLSPDRGDFVEVGSTDVSGVHTFAIQGNGAYVDKTQAITIGSDLLGSHSIGGHLTSAAVEAYHYAREVDLNLDRFEEIQIQLEAQDIGYLSVIRMEFRDIRVLQNKPSKKYRA